MTTRLPQPHELARARFRLFTQHATETEVAHELGFPRATLMAALVSEHQNRLAASRRHHPLPTPVRRPRAEHDRPILFREG